jgi:hypothetical protein
MLARLNRAREPIAGDLNAIPAPARPLVAAAQLALERTSRKGLELANLDRAEREAAHAAAEIGRDRLPSGDAREVTIEVRNEHRQRVLTITVSMHVERVVPSPVAPVA